MVRVCIGTTRCKNAVQVVMIPGGVLKGRHSVVWRAKVEASRNSRDAVSKVLVFCAGLCEER
jgi:hypothetical protein